MASIETTNNTGGDKTAAAIEYHKRQIAAYSQGLINAEAKRDRAVDSGNAAIAGMQTKLDNELAKLEALEG